MSEINFDADNQEYESPNGSEWIVAVGMHGEVIVLKAPNIHPSFLEETDAEMLGLPFEVDDAPGVYKWVCSFEQSRDWETGIVDDYSFEISKQEQLFSLPQDESSPTGESDE